MSTRSILKSLWRAPSATKRKSTSWLSLAVLIGKFSCGTGTGRSWSRKLTLAVKVRSTASTVTSSCRTIRSICRPTLFWWLDRTTLTCIWSCAEKRQTLFSLMTILKSTTWSKVGTFQRTTRATRGLKQQAWFLYAQKTVKCSFVQTMESTSLTLWTHLLESRLILSFHFPMVSSSRQRILSESTRQKLEMSVHCSVLMAPVYPS